MPKLVQLQKQFPDLIVITLNVDFDGGDGSPSPELTQKVTQTLLGAKATCKHHIISATPFETVLEEFELFGLPAAILFDKDGGIAHKFDGKVDLDIGVAEVIAARYQP